MGLGSQLNFLKIILKFGNEMRTLLKNQFISIGFTFCSFLNDKDIEKCIYSNI